MLAGEGPAGTIGDASGIAVGVEIELADLPEVSSVGSCLEGTQDILLAIGAERFIVEIDLDLIVIGSGDFLKGDAEGDQAGEEKEYQCLVHNMIGIIISKFGVLTLSID